MSTNWKCFIYSCRNWLAVAPIDEWKKNLCFHITLEITGRRHNHIEYARYQIVNQMGIVDKCVNRNVVQWTEFARLACACMSAISARTRAKRTYASNVPRQENEPNYTSFAPKLCIRFAIWRYSISLPMIRALTLCHINKCILHSRMCHFGASLFHSFSLHSKQYHIGMDAKPKRIK